MLPDNMEFEVSREDLDKAMKIIQTLLLRDQFEDGWHTVSPTVDMDIYTDEEGMFCARLYPVEDGRTKTGGPSLLIFKL